jgi:hypothetical protein
LTPDDSSVLVTFADVPEAITFGADEVPRLLGSATRLQQYLGQFSPIPMEQTLRWMLET